MFAFSLPAFIQDFPEGSPEDLDLKTRWNINVKAWIQQAMPASPSYFYDPSSPSVTIPSSAAAAAVTWGAFPGRLQQYFSQNPPVAPANPYNLTDTAIFSLADTGYTDATRTQSFPDIPKTLCPQAEWGTAVPPDPTLVKTFGPYGPRGWLDEYCEWSAARDAAGNLVRIDFACENPEYWNTLWKVSPDQVRQIYDETLNWDAPQERQVAVALEDLQLLDGQGNPVIDPETGRPAYNPLNRWNSGPIAVRSGTASSSGGAMHLTSTPNTLQTELGLAGTSTPQFQTGNQDAQALICCGQYGQEYRNSDPHIGQSVNQLVGGEALGTPQLVCLADPVGLYIQVPQNPAAFQFGPNVVVGKLPNGAQASDVWQIVRGSTQVIDKVTGQPFGGNLVLHAVCQIPSAWLAADPNLTLADILINGNPIEWAGQVALQFEIGLFARPLALPAGFPPPTPSSVPCASQSPAPGGGPLQCMYASLWNAYYPINEPAPTGASLSLSSNTTFIPPWLPATGVEQQLVLTCTNPAPAAPVLSAIREDGSVDPQIQVVWSNSSPVTYAVPGNSYPGDYTALYLSVTVAAETAGGLRGLQIQNSGTLPAAFLVVPGD